MPSNKVESKGLAVLLFLIVVIMFTGLGICLGWVGAQVSYEMSYDVEANKIQDGRLLMKCADGTASWVEFENPCIKEKTNESK